MIPLSINLESKFDQIEDHWNPRIVGELNGQHIKLAKIKGEFVWHKHDLEDEMFYVYKGEFEMEFRDKSHLIKEGEFIIVPKGTEHRPVAKEESCIVLFEPISTLNTGDKINERTKSHLDII